MGASILRVLFAQCQKKYYALEMWRLLDPEKSLISPRELHDRVVYVKPGLRKSLVNVFHKTIFHPKITMDQNLLLNTCPAHVLVDNQDPEPFMQTLQQTKPIVMPPYSAHTQPCVKDPQSHGSSLVGSSKYLPNDTILEPSDNGSPGREEGEIPKSDYDLNMRHRLLILQHGQDPGQRDFNSYEPPLLRSMT
ncbi:hypothetical protein SUGI_0615110 [Cryptomeria japonica]|nr:hypothetical protein SUGI_0615110 [Cryptomeria japonica]